ncbi:hypothetical protein HDV05_003301 [Chytridiales sp. JEL 0842]|nr:hypothetical protein HDV05_003301 [Chytridiales sp. JEL 0842]
MIGLETTPMLEAAPIKVDDSQHQLHQPEEPTTASTQSPQDEPHGSGQEDMAGSGSVPDEASLIESTVAELDQTVPHSTTQDLKDDVNVDINMEDIYHPTMYFEEDETIDYRFVYALHTFVANLEGQVCVLKGDTLELLDDSNSYWWLVKCIKTHEIGYIPAENIETPFERLARINKGRNVQAGAITEDDAAEKEKNTAPDRKGIVFNEEPMVFEFYKGGDDDDEHDGEYGMYIEADEFNSGSSSIMASFDMNDGDAFGKASTDVNQASNETGKTKERSYSFFKKLLNFSSQPSTKNNSDRANANVTSLNIRTKSQGTFMGSGFGGGRRRSSVGIEDRDEQIKSRSPVTSPTSPEVHAEPSSGEENVINVIRVYAGNVDLKATFKSIAFNKELTTLDLLKQALRRFRVPSESISEYYLSVLHMDSQERILPDADKVYDTLEALRKKQLPGVSVASVSKVSRAVKSDGKTSSVRMNDDNIIKVLVNKKLNLYEKDYHLIRVFMYDEINPNLRTYKTIAVNSNVTVKAITDMVMKKFKLDLDPEYSYRLCTIIKNTEVLRGENEKIYSIFALAHNRIEDIDFVLKKQWVGEGSAPSNDTSDLPKDIVTSATSANLSSASIASSSGLNNSDTSHDQFESLLKSKPAFLEELPMGSSLKPGSEDDAYVPRIETANDIQPSKSPIAVAAEPTNLVDDDVLTMSPVAMTAAEQYSNSSDGLTLSSLPVSKESSNSSNHSARSAHSQTEESKPSVVMMEKISSRSSSTGILPSFTPAVQPSLSKEGRSLSQSGPVLSGNSLSAAQVAKVDEAVGQLTPIVIMPARKSSLPSHAVRQNSGSEASRTCNGSEALSPSTTLSNPTSPLSPNNPKSEQLPSAPVGRRGSVKMNFQMMEEYLEEMMKENADQERLAALEEALKSAAAPPALDVSTAGSKQPHPPSLITLSTLASPRSVQSPKSPLSGGFVHQMDLASMAPRKYSDSGLSQILRSQRSQPELRSPTFTNAPESLLSPPLTPPNASLPMAQQSSAPSPLSPNTTKTRNPLVSYSNQHVSPTSTSSAHQFSHLPSMQATTPQQSPQQVAPLTRPPSSNTAPNPPASLPSSYYVSHLQTQMALSHPKTLQSPFLPQMSYNCYTSPSLSPSSNTVPQLQQQNGTIGSSRTSNIKTLYGPGGIISQQQQQLQQQLQMMQAAAAASGMGLPGNMYGVSSHLQASGMRGGIFIPSVQMNAAGSGVSHMDPPAVTVPPSTIYQAQLLQLQQQQLHLQQLQKQHQALHQQQQQHHQLHGPNYSKTTAASKAAANLNSILPDASDSL